MKLKKSIGAVLATLAVSSTGLIALAPIASAGVENCQLGAACLWSDYDFNGFKAWNEDPESQVHPSIDNKSKSAAANGASCSATYFYDFYRGRTGSYFILNSKTRIGTNFRDPDLSNGAGIGKYRYQNWENRVSNITFSDCR